MIEHADYRLALILPHSRQLLGIPGPGTVELPVVRIPLWERPAEQLTRQIEARWKIRTIVLDILVDPGSETACAVIEVRTTSWDFAREGFCVAQPDRVGDSSLAESQRRSLSAILFGNEAEIKVFSRIGWIERAQEWIQTSVPDRAIAFSGEIHQLNSSGSFALVRLGTRQGPAYWLKATGEPNDREFIVTITLSKFFPQHLPPLVAERDDWNAWVTEEAGKPLRDSFTLPRIEQTIADLAQLQLRSTEHIPDLLIAGCFDQRAPVLKAHVGELISYLERAMACQSSTDVPRLATGRLRELGRMLEDACSRMEDLRMPDALVHNDINSGNILFNGLRCFFVDWAEACIGNPFSTFQQLYEQVARDKQTQEWCPRLKALYRQRWRTVLTESQIDSAFVLAPLLAIASYLYGRGTWLTSSSHGNLRFQSYARSLARHMDRAARTPQLQELLCR